MNEEYYIRQIKGLFLILKQDKHNVLHKSYVLEKLNMILNGGIGFHPSILKKLDDKNE